MPFSFDVSSPIVWVIGALIVLAIIDVIWLFFLTRKINRLLGGTTAKNIEETLRTIGKELESTAKFKNEVTRYLATAEERIKRSIQGIETVRFNPFKGTGDGGNQSFATAIINENGDGVVVSSLYSRERVSVFSKPIRSFKSEFELTEEENQALQKSKTSLRK